METIGVTNCWTSVTHSGISSGQYMKNEMDRARSSDLRLGLGQKHYETTFPSRPGVMRDYRTIIDYGPGFRRMLAVGFYPLSFGW